MPIYGDGYVYKSLGEQCDDGNLNNDDGCSDKGKIEQGWECIEGIDGKSICSTVCGDNIITGKE